MHLNDSPKRRGVSISGATEVCDVSRRASKASWRFQVQLKFATPSILSYSSQRYESLFPPLLSPCEVRWTTVTPQKKARFLAVSDFDIAAAVDAKVPLSTKTAVLYNVMFLFLTFFFPL